MTALIDGEALIALERGRAALFPALDAGEPVAIAAPTASELLEAVDRAADPAVATQRASFVERLLERVDVVAFDGSAARMRARLEAAGAVADARALDVAAIALSRGWRVATTNGRYERIPGLDVVRL
ncbi:MAG: hypothetical protein ACRDJM_07715 [Actinomycetota bacterium]